MKFTVQGRDALHVVFERPAEAIEVLGRLGHDHRKLDPYSPEMLAYVRGEKTEAVLGVAPRTLQEGGGWMAFELESTWLDPYWALVTTRTGSTDKVTVDLTHALGQYKATRCLERAVYNHERELMEVTMYKIVYLPSNFTGDVHEYGERQAYSYLHEELGHRPPVPEYLPTRNGQFVRNPDYPHKRNPIKQGVYHDAVWRCIWEAWAAAFATPLQKIALSRIHRVWPDRADEGYPKVRDYQGFHLSGCHEHVSWSEFQDDAALERILRAFDARVAAQVQEVL